MAHAVQMNLATMTRRNLLRHLTAATIVAGMAISARADDQAVRYMYQALDQVFSKRDMKNLPVFFTPNFKIRLQGGKNANGMVQLSEWKAFMQQSKGSSCKTNVTWIRTVGNKVYAKIDRRIHHYLIEPRTKKKIEFAERWQTNEVSVLQGGKWRIDEMEIVSRDKWADGKKLGQKK